MDRKETLEKKLEALEELDALQKKEEEQKQAATDKSDKYDLRALTDPRELGGLRKLVTPQPFRFPGKPKQGQKAGKYVDMVRFVVCACHNALNSGLHEEDTVQMGAALAGLFPFTGIFAGLVNSYLIQKKKGTCRAGEI